MYWFLCLLWQPAFERQGDATIFFPYGHAWAGYEYNSDLRAQIRPLLITYVGFATLLLIAYQLLSGDHDTDAASQAIYPEAMLLFCFYMVGTSAATRGLPKIHVDLNGNSPGLMVARIFPVWAWSVLVGLAALMTTGGIAVAIMSTTKTGDWLADSQPATFFGLALLTFIGELRLRRRLERQPAMA